jgi:hypothetical protein
MTDTTLAENIVFVAWDLDRNVCANNLPPIPLRSALKSRRFVSALLEVTYRGLELAFSRSQGPAEPITNFQAPVLLKLDAVIEAAAPEGEPIVVEEMERVAGRLSGLVPGISASPELVEQVIAFASTYQPNFAPAAPEAGVPA